MNDVIRVLQVTSYMGRGGAETMIMNLYRNIDRSKVQFDFVEHSDETMVYKDTFNDEILSLGGKIIIVPRYRGSNHFEYVKWWKSFFNSHPEYKVIHGHIRSTASIYLKIANKCGLTTIAHSHSTSSGTGAVAKIKDIIQYPIRNTADWLFACSLEAGKWLYGNNVVSKNNFKILNNAIDTEKYVYNKNIRQYARQKLNTTDKYVLGHVGRFNKPKNHEFLVDIFHEVHKQKPNAILLLIGDGGLRNQIEKKVADLGLSDAVIFTGVRSDVSELLQAMDVFLFPSLYEGLPVTLIEAQAAGLPIVASNSITNEVCITDLISMLSLQQPVQQWAQEVLKYESANFKRGDTAEKIKACGYDIRQTSEWLQELYISSFFDNNMIFEDKRRDYLMTQYLQS